MADVNNYTCGLNYISFMVVIYDHHDSCLYSKTTILANLSVATSVNYDHKVRYKLKHTFQS